MASVYAPVSECLHQFAASSRPPVTPPCVCLRHSPSAAPPCVPARLNWSLAAVPRPACGDLLSVTPRQQHSREPSGGLLAAGRTPPLAFRPAWAGGGLGRLQRADRYYACWLIP